MIIEHLEKHLGDQHTGWIEESLPFQVWRFEDQPIRGAATFTTVGLSKHALKQGQGTVHQELIFSCYPIDPMPPVHNRLFAVGRELLETHDALAQGQLLGPRGPLFEGVALEALLCFAPVYFPDSFHQFTIAPDESGLLVWLLPLHRIEANFVREHGWRRFDWLFVEHDPDALDLTRPPMTLGFC